jgi:RNA recognition motif-containing protein
MNNSLKVVVPNQSGTTERNVLWVSELPDTITEKDIEIFFGDYKDNVIVIQIYRSGRVIDYFAPKSLNATIIFRDNSVADEARRGLNMRKLRGKTIRIMWHEKDNRERYNNMGNLFVKYVPGEVKPREFYEKFADFGDIVSAKLCEDEEGIHLGYGYVNYYNKESADNAIQALNDKEVWPGQVLEVAHFQKKNERLQSLSVNKNLYVKNLPVEFNEENVKSFFVKYGTVTWTKVYLDEQNRKSAIVSYDNESSANMAKELNGFNLLGNELYVDTLQKRTDRKRILSSKINDNNYRLNSQFKNCNLHIRNLPYEITEEALHEVFSKFGEIKSVKIPKMLLTTKVMGQFKEYLMNKGFGYVCYFDQESTRAAKEELNGKIFPGYENWKRPMLIDLFMPKYERNQILNRLNQDPTGKEMPFMNQFGARQFAMPFNMNPQMAKGVRVNMHQTQQNNFKRGPRNQAQVEQITENLNTTPIVNNLTYPIPATLKVDDPDIKYLHSLEDESAKRDYLGEFLFRKIENNPLILNNNHTIDTIGKITGMILGIEEISEIVDITLNHENLTLRISEAINLIDNHGA